MSPAEVKALLDAGEKLQLLDVREAEELAIASLGAKHIPLGELTVRVSELDPDAKTVVICHHGSRSARAVGYLQTQGFKEVHNLNGGIDLWSTQVDPRVPRY